MRTIWWKGLVAASAVALVTAGCGSDSGGGSGGSSSGGGDVNIMVLSQLDAPDFAFPEIKDVFTVATDQVNKAGGINGHQINVTYCNDQGNANAAGACARQAVSGKMALVVGPFSLFGSSILPILEAAKIPYAGNAFLSQNDATSPMSFPFSSGTVTSGAAVGERFVKEGCTKAGAIGYDQAASDAYIGFVKDGMKTGGGDIISTAHVAPGTPDYAPALATLTSAGVGCIFISLPAGEAAKFMGAVAQSGQHVLVGTGITTLPQVVISKLPPAATEGVVLTATSYSPSDDVPTIKDMQAQLQAAGVSDTSRNGSFTTATWGDAQIIFGALKGISGTIDASSALKALGQIDKPASDMFGDFSTTQPGKATGLPRLFNLNALNYTVHNGVATLNSPEFVDVSNALEG